MIRGTLLSVLFFALLWGGAPAFAGSGCGICSSDGYCPSGSPSAGFSCKSIIIIDPDGGKTTYCFTDPSGTCNYGAPEY